MRKAATFPALAVLLVVTSFLGARPEITDAATLVTSPQMEGLTFATSLASPVPQALQFPQAPALTIHTTNSNASLAAMVTVSPSPETVQTTITPSPTPTVRPRGIFIMDTAIATRVTPTPTPTATPQANQQVLAANTASASVPSNPGGLNADKLFGMVNAYRQSINLPAFQKDERSCSLAASRAPEINNEIATGTMHQGLKNRNLPYWNTENIISMNSEEAALNWWLNDYIHKKAIEGNFTYSCVACSGNACAEEFTNFQPK